MLGSIALGSYQLGQGFPGGAVVEPPEVEVEPDVVSVTAGIRTQVEASAHLRSRVSVTAGMRRQVSVHAAQVRTRVLVTAGIRSMVHLQLER